MSEVQLQWERFLQVIDERLELDGGGEPGNRLDDLLQHRQIRRHQVLNIRVLHLDGDLSPVVQPRTMHLGNRGRGDRLPLDLGKHVLWTPAELAGDGLLDLRPGASGHAVLQRGQGANVDGGEQVRARGGELASLDQRPAEGGGRLQHPVRAALVLQLPVPRLYQGGQPLRTFTERAIPDEDIRGDGGQHQRAREGLTNRNHARGMFLHLESSLRPEKCIRAGQIGQAGKKQSRIGRFGSLSKDRPRLLDGVPRGLVEDPPLLHRSLLLHLDAAAFLSVTSAVRSSTLCPWPSWATPYGTR